MALTVTIYDPASATTYSLLSTVVEHNFIRYPSQIAQPGISATKADRVFTLDLGMCRETLGITGIVDVTNAPTLANMRTVIKGWWTTSAINTNLIKVTIDPTGLTWFYCRVMTSQLQLIAGELNRWQLHMVFLVDSKGS